MKKHQMTSVFSAVTYRLLALSSIASIAAAGSIASCVAGALLSSPEAHAAPSIFTARALENAMLDLYCTYPGQAVESCPKKPSLPAPVPVSSEVPASENPDFQNPATASENPALANRPQPKTTAAFEVSAKTKTIWALETFDHAAQLNTEEFNDFMTHLAADYRQHPEHRLAIELMLGSINLVDSKEATGTPDHTSDAIREKLREELKNNTKRNTLLTVMDDVLITFAVAYSFEFGRSVGSGQTLWESGGKGLTKIKRFKQIIRYAVENDKIATSLVNKNKWILGASGVGLGLIDTVAQPLFSTFKIDPRHLLVPVQGNIVHTMAERVAAERDEIRAMAEETDEALKLHANDYRGRMTEIERDMVDSTHEMEHIFSVSAEFRPQMEPIAEDLTEIGKKLENLENRIGRRQLSGGRLK